MKDITATEVLERQRLWFEGLDRILEKYIEPILDHILKVAKDMEVEKINRLIEFYRSRPIGEEDNIIIIRALEFYRDNQSFPK